MGQSGNHGGSSPAETQTTLAFIASQPWPRRDEPATGREGEGDREGKDGPARARVVRQVDFVPTVALLLGLPIPRNSFGTLLAELLPASLPERARWLQLNTAQLLRLAQGQALFAGQAEQLEDWRQLADTAHNKGHVAQDPDSYRTAIRYYQRVWLCD